VPLINYGPTPTPKSRKSLKFILGVCATIIAVILGTTFAANINLNTGHPVEFGQGIAQTTACTGNDYLTVTANAGYVNGVGSKDFKLTSLSLTHIPNSCWEKSFLFQVYGTSGPVIVINSSDTSVSATYEGTNSYSSSGTISNATGENTPGSYGTLTLAIADPVALTTDISKLVVQSSNNGSNLILGNLDFWVDASNPASFTNSAPNTWVDLVHGHNFVLQNTSYSSAGGGSIQFDGTGTSWAWTPDSFTPAWPTRTLSFWVNFTDTSICGYLDSSAGGFGVTEDVNSYSDNFETIDWNESCQGWEFGSSYYRKTLNSGNSYFYSPGQAPTLLDNIEVGSTYFPQPNTWEMITAVYAPEGYKMYRNGFLFYDQPNNYLQNFNFPTHVIIGPRAYVTGYPEDPPAYGYGGINAKVGAAYIWNKNLSDGEVVKVFNATKSRYGL
jgi:hypothetical protein